MQNFGSLRILGILIFMFLFQLISPAQSKKYFVITGRIEPEMVDDAATGVIEVTKNGSETSTIAIPKNRRFRFELEFFNDYNLNFKYPGHFNKIIQVSTQIPQEVWERDNDFPPFPMIVQMLKEFEGIDKSFALKPQGRIFYDKETDNFEKESLFTDLQFSEQIATAKTKANQVQKESQSISKVEAKDMVAKQKDFDQLIKEADTHYQRGEYQMALMKYLEAHKLFPEKAYPNDRVAELQDLVKALEITEKKKAELEQKYKDAIAKANGFFDKKSYTEARPGYEEALQYKPGDVFANGRINEIDQLLALQAKQKQYDDLIAQADNSYKSKSYDQALTQYNQAKQLVPNDQYSQKQIDLINQEKLQQAKLEQLEKDFNETIQAANTLVKQKDYLQALSGYKKALELKPDNQLARDKISETEKEIALQETDKQYQQAIQLADQALAANDFAKAKMQFQEALKFKANESYPKDKLAQIADTESKEIRFNELIAGAEKAIPLGNFDESLNLLAQALEIKPKNATIQKRIDEVQNLKKVQLADKEYAGLIAQADQAYQNDQLDQALSAYSKALDIKKLEAYPKGQIQKIEFYQSTIKKADKSFDSKDYPASLGGYNEALSVKANDAYANKRIIEINGLLDARKKQDEQMAAEVAAFNDLIKNGDQLFAAQNYPESLNKFKEASAMKDSEAYPKKKIKEIETILSDQEKEKARVEKEYQTIIVQADKLLDKKDYANSQAEYRKALVVKPNDSYSTAQIKKIDDALAEIRRQEDETQRQLLAKQDKDFNDAMAAGDQAFNANDFVNAMSGYQKALSIKPNDQTAKNKYASADAKLAQQNRLNQSYNAAITEANKRLTDKRYPEAKEKYQEALQYAPESDYPKRQISKIDELLAQQEAEIKLRKDFDQAVAEAESLLKNKELAKAKDTFMKAYNLIPSEPIPPQRISEINALLSEQAQKDAQLKATMDAYQNAVQRADKLFGSKDYASAQLVYGEASLIKPDEKYPTDQIELIDKLLKEQNDQKYQATIAKADNSFNTNQFTDATTSYQEALTYKKNDPYATRRLKEIEQKLADLAAEKDRLKKTQDQYNALLADADNDLKNKEYQKSRDKYTKASGLKPEEIFPKDQIAKIDQILKDIQKQTDLDKQYTQFINTAQEEFSQNKLKEARSDYQKAFNVKPNEPLPLMRITEIDRLLAQQEETAKLAAMEEAQRIAKAKADKEQYDRSVAAGDKAFAEKQYKIARTHYTNALIGLPNEKYPKDQITKIDELLAQLEREKTLAVQQAQRDSIQRAKDLAAFNATMTAAAELDRNKRYPEAIAKYEDAIKIKPEQKASVQKLISDIEDKIQLLAKQDTEYKRIIKQADDLYASTKLEDALTEYQNAATIKPEEDYPKKQISEIQSLLAARDQSYANAIKNGDKAYEDADWQGAKSAYTEALAVKPKETYPANRLKEVNQKIADANQAVLASASEDKAYKDAVDKGEKSLKEDQLTTAKMHFEVAKSLKPAEKLPVDRIREIDALIDQRNKERLAQAQRDLDEKYRQAISVADNSFREKSYNIAKLQYKQALLIKPDESYPKSQMALCDKFLNEAPPVETYVFKVPEVQPAAPKIAPVYNPVESVQATEARAQSFKTITDYDEAIKKADDSFGVKDYSVARFFYSKASDIKPNEKYPKDQLELIHKLIDSELSGSDLSGYEQALAQADAAFGKQDYTIAKFYYYKALEIKSWEKYPKDRIDEILALTNSLLSEREEKEYRDAIAKADEAFFNKDISIARFYYNRAISIKREEDYPRIKLKDIQKLIEQDKLDRQNQEYNKLIEQADQALQLENFSMARFNYNKALVLKPDEKYPKDQLKRIKEALDKQDN
jgi:hypothetical protein